MSFFHTLRNDPARLTLNGVATLCIVLLAVSLVAKLLSLPFTPPTDPTILAVLAVVFSVSAWHVSSQSDTARGE